VKYVGERGRGEGAMTICLKNRKLDTIVRIKCM